MVKQYGALKDKFDEAAHYHVPKVVKVPESMDYSQYIPQILNQDGCNQCTGCGFGGDAATVAAYLGIVRGNQPIYDSIWWLYNGGRKAQGWLNQDCGAYPDDVGNWFVNQGLLYYNEWPTLWKPMSNTIIFDPTDPITKASKALLYPNRQKIRVDNGIDGIVSALAENPAVAIATPWFTDWGGYSSGVLPAINQNSAVGGRHQTFLWGYSKSRGTVKGSNSWGKWGILIPALGTTGGYEMDMEAFEQIKKWHGGYDAHYLTFDVLPNPPEPPDPYEPPEPPVPPKPNQQSCICKIVKTAKVAVRSAKMYWKGI